MKISQLLMVLTFVLTSITPGLTEIIPLLEGYENVEITKVEPDGIRVTHKNGVAKIKFEALPEEMRKKYGYSEDKAREFRQKTESDQEKAGRLIQLTQALDTANVGVVGTVDSVEDGGVLLVNILCTLGKKVEVEQIDSIRRKTGTGGALSRDSGELEYTLKTKWVQPKGFEAGPVFVACDTTGIFDGKKFKAIIFPAGVYKGGSGTQVMWTTFPDAFAAAEGLGEIPDYTIAAIQERYKDYPAIPRRKSQVVSCGGASTGTGFAVGDGTIVVTCAHVVEGYRNFIISSEGGKLECELLSSDTGSDVAVLKLKSGKLRAAKINTLGAETGESVFTLGFPNPDLQGSEAKLTDGRISSLSGIKGDQKSMQITVPVQPGNSGGPLFNMQGDVVGIVTSKLGAANALNRTGALPENVNYATKVNAITKAIPLDQMKSATTSGKLTTAPPPLTVVVKQVRGSVVQVIAK